eukprot:11174670-Lingulodinium_polyedra.AAC.1
MQPRELPCFQQDRSAGAPMFGWQSKCSRRGIAARVHFNGQCRNMQRPESCLANSGCKQPVEPSVQQLKVASGRLTCPKLL